MKSAIGLIPYRLAVDTFVKSKNLNSFPFYVLSSKKKIEETIQGEH